MKDKHTYFMSVAMLTANQSRCIKRRVGAVLVSGESIISTGYNGTPKGEPNCDDIFGPYAENPLPIEEHHEWSRHNEIHAEVNCILQAARRGIATDGCTLYVTTEPCDDCLKMLIAAGIKEVYYCDEYRKDCCASSYRNGKSIALHKMNDNKQMKIWLISK